jgi:hypothetical protein
MTKNTLIPSNIGKTIKPNAVEAGKFDVNLDGTTLKADAAGQISVNGQALSANLISSDIPNDLTAGVDGKLKTVVTIKGVAVDGVTLVPNVLGIVNITDLDITGVSDSSTVDLSLVGTTVSASVIISSSLGNLLKISPTGLEVSPSDIRTAVFDVEVQDAFGVFLYYASSTNS